jgi:hypothetical protein
MPRGASVGSVTQAAEDMPPIDVGEVVAVVLREVDRVVRNVVVAALDAEVQHERRAGESP